MDENDGCRTRWHKGGSAEALPSGNHFIGRSWFEARPSPPILGVMTPVSLHSGGTERGLTELGSPRVAVALVGLSACPEASALKGE